MTLRTMSLNEINRIIQNTKIPIKDIKRDPKYGYWILVFKDPAIKPYRCLGAETANLERNLLWYYRTGQLVGSVKRQYKTRRFKYDKRK